VSERVKITGGIILDHCGTVNRRNNVQKAIYCYSVVQMRLKYLTSRGLHRPTNGLLLKLSTIAATILFT